MPSIRWIVCGVLLFLVASPRIALAEHDNARIPAVLGLEKLTDHWSVVTAASNRRPHNGANSQNQTALLSLPGGLAARWAAESNTVAAHLGSSVASAGDVNGDGYDDVVVGAPEYSNGETYEGRSSAYYGSALGLSNAANWMVESNQEFAGLGNAVASAGDVNSDGYDDVIVGAYSYSNGEFDEGLASVYYGSALGLSNTANWSVESNQSFARFGASVASAGDVNGDGYDDVIVGAFGYTNGQTDEGGAFVYYGSAAGLNITPAWTAESDQAYARFGNSVASAGDVNSDGYDDIVLGAESYDNGETDEGRAFVYHGSSIGPSPTPDWTGEPDQASSFFGHSVDSAGDVNGDGYSDVVVGAYAYDNGQTDEGRTFVYDGSSIGLSATPNWTAESDQALSSFGLSVASAGDVNGDHYDDLSVGASGYDNGQTDEGRTFVYHGSATGLSLTPSWTAESNQASSFFGASVASAGDVNDDGYADVIVGSPLFEHGQLQEGVCFAYLGSAKGLRH